VRRAAGVATPPATPFPCTTLFRPANGSALNLTGGFIEAANGGQVNVAPSATSPLITLHGGSHTLGASAIGVSGGGQFSGGSASASLIQLDNAQLTGPEWVRAEEGRVGNAGGTSGWTTLAGDQR